AEGVMGVVSDWVGREGHGEPHQFRVTRYRYAGESFERLPESRTRQRYESWCPAAQSAGLPCSHPYGDIAPLRWHSLRWHSPFHCPAPLTSAGTDKPGRERSAR